MKVTRLWHEYWECFVHPTGRWRIDFDGRWYADAYRHPLMLEVRTGWFEGKLPIFWPTVDWVWESSLEIREYEVGEVQECAP